LQRGSHQVTCHVPPAIWTCQKGAGKPRNNSLRRTSKQQRIREIQATCHVRPPIWTCQNGAWKTSQQQTREEMKADRETTTNQTHLAAEAEAAEEKFQD
jgi:hypothetical protein